jgi:DNA-binding response OmpR family regulator
MQPDVETHTLETHIYRLRSKLDALTPKPCDIITLDGAYQLTMDIA